ncbi:MAG: hypothetical protein K2X82_09130, partial [Gemmataceae bacterium]|nr:hypothetical protein [Gemmataceae bacterium]
MATATPLRGGQTGTTGSAGFTGGSQLAGRDAGRNDGAHKHSEGPVARGIEHYTAQAPSDWFLWAGGASIIASATLQLLGRKEDANFVGHWAPTFLILGLYNK